MSKNFRLRVVNCQVYSSGRTHAELPIAWRSPEGAGGEFWRESEASGISMPAMLGLGRGVSGRLSQSLTSRCMRWRRRSVGKIPPSPFRASATTNSPHSSITWISR